MDLLYLSEGFPYHPLRSGYTYDKYESQNEQAKSSVQRKKSPAQDSHKSGDSCQLCREKQKRALASYIRSKSIESAGKNTIAEECEEE